MNIIRIILIEDHAVVREGTRHLLEQVPDLRVVGEASNGVEGLELIERHRPDVVVLDIAMPGMNGIEVTRQIKKRWPEVAVLVLTAYDDEEYIFAIVDAGGDGFLLKDVPGDEVIRAVKAVHSGEPVLHPAAMRTLMFRASTPSHSERAAAGPAAVLSEREREVIRCAARGLTNVQIANELDVSPRTIQTHFRNVFAKLNVSSRTEAVVVSLRLGLVSLRDAGSGVM